MQIDRGFNRETIVIVNVDLSSGVAGQIACIECEGTGDWGKFMPEPLTNCPCIECKGTGYIWVSV